ncbi:MAG: PEP-CTERM sorting domain-containing protein [Planctomycetota bacterium]
MKKKVVIAGLVLMLTSSAVMATALFEDDFTSDTLSNYKQSKYFNWYWAGGSGIPNTITWDTVTNMNVSSNNAYNGTALLQKNFERPAGSTVSATFGPTVGLDSHPKFYRTRPLGLIISDRLFDDSPQYYADFKGYVFENCGNYSYFHAMRFEGLGTQNKKVDLGIKNPTQSAQVPTHQFELIFQPTATGFDLLFDSDYLEDYGVTGPEVLFSDNSGALNDVELKYFGIIWGTWDDRASDPDGIGSFWNGAPIDKITVVPEPATVCLLGLGGLALIGRKRA